MSSGAALSQEEILSSVKTVAQGLEALKAENQQILAGLASSVDSIRKESGDASFVERKAQIITKSVESLELGIGEAQVSSNSYCSKYFRRKYDVGHTRLILDNSYVFKTIFRQFLIRSSVFN